MPMKNIALTGQEQDVIVWTASWDEFDSGLLLLVG